MTKVWQTLQDSGTQEGLYPDSPRRDVREMFVHEPLRVLDIGCGVGAVAGGIKFDLPHVFAWGCELNPNAADIAQTRLDKVSRKPIEEWDDEELQLLKTIDTVLLLDVLEHMYNPWLTLQMLSQHLPDHAQVIVSLPNIANVNVMHEMSKGYWQYKAEGILDVTHIRFFTVYEMQKMYYETGFRVDVQKFPYLLGSTQYVKPFPFWFETDSFKVLVRDEAHWLSLNAIQIYFRLRKTADADLTAEELNMRHGEHPYTVS